jgi:antitoxin (DNA-binding transcriptional repressor) of toxin-antitoxin stability system
MRVVNVKELKAKLSAYLRDVGRGEEYLVTDRRRVVARLGPPASAGPVRDTAGTTDPMARLLALGARPPTRARRPTDYRRAGPALRLPADRIDALLDWVREERR